jgi:hypothetical protein
MEPVHLLFHKAQESRLLKRFNLGNNIVGGSLYADDATLFIHPTERELRITDFILQLFASTSGLVTNMAKTKYCPFNVEILILNSLLLIGLCPPYHALIWDSHWT